MAILLTQILFLVCTIKSTSSNIIRNSETENEILAQFSERTGVVGENTQNYYHDNDKTGLLHDINLQEDDEPGFGMQAASNSTLGGEGMEIYPFMSIERGRNESFTHCHDTGSSFDLAEVIVEGMLYHGKICPFSCDTEFHVKHSHSACSSSKPVCGMCNCDAKCSQYGDCCDINPLLENATDTISAPQPAYTCFRINPQISVFIISSCSDDNLIFQPEEFKEPSLNNSENTTSGQNHFLESVLRCNSCLGTPTSIDLITSNITGETYCNHFCLECSEHRHTNGLDITWSKEESCRVVNSGTEMLSNDSWYGASLLGTASGAVNMVDQCSEEYLQPEEVAVRQCDNRLTQSMISTCSWSLTRHIFNTGMAKFRDLENLCHSYYLPVFTMEAAYRNVFCYLCQGNRPLPCEDIVQSDETMSAVYEVTLVLLTDISDGEDDVYGDESSFHDDTEDDTDNDGTSEDEDEFWGMDVYRRKAGHRCADGYWASPGKRHCHRILCAADRNLSKDVVTGELFCQPEDTEETDETSIYILNLVWYFYEVHHLSDPDLGYSNTNNTHNGKSIDYGDRGDQEARKVQLEDDVSRKSSGILHGDTPPVRIPRESAVNGWDKGVAKNANGQAENDIRKNEITIFPAVPTAKTDLNTKTESGGLNSNSISEQRVKKLRVELRRENLVTVVQNYIRFQLDDVNVTDYVLQFYRFNSDTSFDSKYDKLSHETNRFQRDRLDNNIVAIPLSVNVGLFINFTPTSNQNRRTFEKNIVRSFVGKTNMTILGHNVTVDLTLPDSTSTCLDKTLQIRKVNPITGECYAVHETNPLLEKTSCPYPNPKVIHFSMITSCPHVRLNTSDFNSTRELKIQGKDIDITLNRHQYLLEDGTISVCVKLLNSQLSKTPRRTRKMSLLKRVESILTLVTLSLSLACLLMTFVTYCVFPMLRSLPGKNNMVMIGCLFVSQLLLLLNPLSPKHSQVCVVTGVLLHYCWLCTFTWTTVCSFHMFHVFVIRRAAPTSRKSHRFYLTRYALVSNAPCTVTVCLVIFINLYLTDGQTTGYGGRVCYLNSTLLVGVAFILPLSIIILTNLILFTLTIITIGRIKEVKRQTGQERRNVHVYFRLSSLTGLCWILALVAEIPGLQVLRCVSVLVNGCQGVTLFLSYACNRRVARMWCHLLQNKGTVPSRTTTGSSRQQTSSSFI